MVTRGQRLKHDRKNQRLKALKFAAGIGIMMGVTIGAVERHFGLGWIGVTLAYVSLTTFIIIELLTPDTL
jgi:hypothetical protein